MRNKTKPKNTFPQPLPYSWAQLHSWLLCLLLPRGTAGWGTGIAVSLLCIVSVAPSSSPFAIRVSHPQETALRELLQHRSFPWAAVLHEPLPHGHFSRGAVLQERTAPARVPYGVASPAGRPAPAQDLNGVTASLGPPPALTWGPPWAAGRYLFHCGPSPWAAQAPSLLWCLEHLLLLLLH